MIYRETDQIVSLLQISFKILLKFVNKDVCSKIINIIFVSLCQSTLIDNKRLFSSIVFS